MASVTSAYIMLKRLNFLNVSACFKVGKNSFSCFKSSHTCILAAIKNFRFILSCFAAFNNFIGSFLISLTCHMAVISESTNNRKIVAKPYFKVIRVVRRSDFNNTCTFSHIGMFITNNRNFLIKKRKNDMATVKMFISRVITVNCNSGITKHSFRAGSSKFKLFTRFLYFIKKMPEV